jgi:hypothetical protein
MTDHLDEYATFQNLSDDAMALVRENAARLRVDADPTAEAEVSPRVAAVTECVIDGKPPLPTVAARADQMEASQRHAEAWVENYYVKKAPAYLAVHLLFGADDRIRSISEHAKAIYADFFGYGGDGLVVQTVAGQKAINRHFDLTTIYFD